MQNPVIPGSRLYSAVPYLTRGVRVADVGTDHAYLPIFLVREGIASFAVASDINQGPIDSARENIREVGLEEKIATLLTDGLHGVEEYRPDAILIFGMGGELISSILDEAPWVRSPDVRLILQPMTRAATLRAYLAKNGFSGVGETLTREGERYYQTICAAYTGREEHPTEEELLLGGWNLSHPSPILRDFIAHEIKVYEKIRAGKAASSSADTEEEDRVLSFLRNRLEKLP